MCNMLYMQNKISVGGRMLDVKYMYVVSHLHDIHV